MIYSKVGIMAIYDYEDLKKTAIRVKAELALEGIILEKKIRKKPRDEEKRELLFEMAINRLKKFKPKRTEKGIILPYYRI